MRTWLFLLNILLAVLWMFMWGEFDLYTLLVGFAIGYILLALASREMLDGGRPYGHRVWRVTVFSVYFLRILVKANLQVAWEIVTPGFHMTPAILRYDVSGMTDLQITTLANAITLTPGTLSVDVADGRDSLYVHCMYAKDRDVVIEKLDELRYRLMKEIFE